jgi:hypothetical protein
LVVADIAFFSLLGQFDLQHNVVLKITVIV